MSIPGIIALLSIGGALAALAALSSIVASRFRRGWFVHFFLLGPPLLILLGATVGVGVLTSRFRLDDVPFIGTAAALLLGIVLMVAVLTIGAMGTVEPRARRWRPGLTLGALILFVIGAVCALVWIDRRALEEIDTRRAGMAALRESIAVDVADDEDAGPSYLAVVRMFQEPETRAALDRARAVSESASFNAADAREALAPLQGGLDLVYEATTRRCCTIGATARTLGFSSSLSDLQELSRLGRLLALEARLAAADGDSARAAAALHALTRLADHVAQTPAFIAVLMGDRIRVLARETYVEAGALVELDPACLVSGTGSTMREELKRAFVLERVVLTDLVCDVATGQFSSDYLDGITATPSALELSPAQWAYRAISLRTDLAEIDEHFDRYQAALNRAGDSFKPVGDIPKGILASILLPSLDAAIALVDQAEAIECILPVAAATRRFKREHGRWPSSLNELVPDHLDAVPIDQLSPELAPLSMAIVDGDLVIYSVGPNGTDDGGRIDPRGRADVGVRLKR